MKLTPEMQADHRDGDATVRINVRKLDYFQDLQSRVEEAKFRLMAAKIGLDPARAIVPNSVSAVGLALNILNGELREAFGLDVRAFANASTMERERTIAWHAMQIENEKQRRRIIELETEAMGNEDAPNLYGDAMARIAKLEDRVRELEDPILQRMARAASDADWVGLARDGNWGALQEAINAFRAVEQGR
jgi:hypothetical protein